MSSHVTRSFTVVLEASPLVLLGEYLTTIRTENRMALPPLLIHVARLPVRLSVAIPLVSRAWNCVCGSPAVYDTCLSWLLKMLLCWLYS